MSEMTCGVCEGEGSACAVDHAKGLISACVPCAGTGKVKVCTPFRQSLLLTTVLDRLLGFAKRSQFDDNDRVRAYTIQLPSALLEVQEDYLTRFLTPKVGPMRLMLHHIHRPDSDRHLHNHPWDAATSVILNGGYVETRFRGTLDEFMDKPLRHPMRSYRPGDINHLRHTDYHRIESIEDETWTLFINDTRRPEGWGYLVDGKHQPRVSNNTDKDEA